MSKACCIVLTTAAACALAGAATAADAMRGAALYESRCGACHSLDADRVGPRHRGVFGRRAGSVPGYEYSPALRRASVVWNAQTLERWLADPEVLVPGQRMNISVPEARDRDDLIDFLKHAK